MTHLNSLIKNQICSYKTTMDNILLRLNQNKILKYQTLKIKILMELSKNKFSKRQETEVLQISFKIPKN